MKKDIEEVIESALRTEPGFKLTTDFSHKVIKAIRARERRSQRKIYLWMILGILFLCGSGATILLLYFPGLISALSSESQVNNLVPLAILIGVLVVFVQYLDKKLIKDRLILR